MCVALGTTSGRQAALAARTPKGGGAAAPILSTLKELERRAVDSDKRHWRLTTGLIALAVGGGAGAAQLLRGLIGG